MKYRRSPSSSRGLFRAGNKIHPKNVALRIPRGGYRL